MTSEQGSILLKVSREAVAKSLGLPASPVPREEWMSEIRATFVTIRNGNELRGCIGSIEPHRSLYEDVRENAERAAFSDPRFRPITTADWDRIHFEISILSPMEELGFSDEEDAISKLKSGHDGLVFQCNGRQATFLPQVWESLPSPKDFLIQLKQKAGCSPGFWSDQVKLWRYTVEKFGEPHGG